MTQGTSPAVGATPIGARDIETTYKGIALVARGPEPMPDPFETQMLSAVLVRWHELRRLSLVDPWPCFRIRWSSRGVRAEDAYGPRGDADAHDFARAVERLVEVTRVHAEHLIDQGWLAAPDTPWEPTAGLPHADAPPAAPALGAFRTAARDAARPEHTVIAQRGAPPTFEALVVWLRSGPARPLTVLPREVRVTADDTVHVRWRDGRCARVPLDALRCRLDVPLDAEDSADAVYVFGRATRLLLLGRHACEVAQLFDRRLAVMGRASG